MFKFKKLAALALTGAMAASMAVPAFAAATNSTTVTATYKEIPIAVTVPQTGTVTINPYGLPINVTKSDEKTEVPISEQIMNVPKYISNESSIALDVGATVSTTLKGNLKLSATPISTSTTAVTTNSAFVFLELSSAKYTGNVPDAESEDAEKDANAVNDAVIEAYAGWEARDLKTVADAKDVLILKGGSSTTAAGVATFDITADEKGKTSGLFTLDPITAAQPGNGDDVQPTPATYQTDSVAMFRLSGDVVKSPKTAWTKSDGFTAVIAFTFAPHDDGTTG